MRYFYDGEFNEDGWTIDLLSIGIVAEDGREYYAINQDANWRGAGENEWLRDNVLPYLPVHCGPGWTVVDPTVDDRVKPRARIAKEVAAFISADSPIREENELWAYYSAYDHVALCQLWGRMVDLPPAVPMYTNDLQQILRMAELSGVEVPRVPQKDEHNALADARWNMAQFNTAVEAMVPRVCEVASLCLGEMGNVSMPRPYAQALFEAATSQGDSLDYLKDAQLIEVAALFPDYRGWEPSA